MPKHGSRTLYHTALEALAPSADDALEQMRWRVARCQIEEREASPGSIGRLSRMGDAWGAYAFKDLRLTGFIENSIDAFTWQNFDDAHLGSHLDLMAGFEASAILRSRFIDMSAVRWELEYRRRELKRVAEGGAPLAIVLALQKLFVTLVASIGSTELFSEYVTASRTGICYAWADRLSRSDVDRLARCADRIVDLIGSMNVREGARICSSLRLLPIIEDAGVFSH